MNAYYNKNRQINSNNRIYESYFTESARPVSKWQELPEMLLSLLFSMLRALASSRARTVVRVCTVAICLVGFIGIIGAVEYGSLSLLGGALIGSLLIGLEFLALRPRKQK